MPHLSSFTPHQILCYYFYFIDEERERESNLPRVGNGLNVCASKFIALILNMMVLGDEGFGAQ